MSMFVEFMILLFSDALSLNKFKFIVFSTFFRGELKLFPINYKVFKKMDKENNFFLKELFYNKKCHIFFGTPVLTFSFHLFLATHLLLDFKKKKKRKIFSKKVIIRYKLIHTNTSLKNKFSIKQLLEI